MQRITSNSEIEEVMRSIGVGEGEELRESEKRRRNLERFAQLRSRNPNATVSLADTHTAFVQADDEDSGEFLDITITTREFPQERYEIPEEYHHYLIQKGMTIHEAAHVMYSSYPALKNYIDKVEDEEDGVHAQMFQNIYNALEDGAIEHFAQNDYRVKEELFHLRATIHEANYMGQEVDLGEQKQYHYPFYYAIMAALINIGVYDNGELRKLLDEDNDQHKIAARGGDYDREMLVEILPEIRSSIEDIQDERDAEKRAELSYDLWEYLKKYIDRSTTPGKNEMQRQMDNRDANSYGEGVPENVSSGHGEQQKTPSTQGDSDEISHENETLGDERKEIQEEIKKGGSDDIEENAKENVIQESKDESGDWSDVIEEIIDSLGAGEGTDEIFIPDDKEVDSARKRESQRYGKRCAKIFRTRLQKLQKDKELRGKRRGDFDTRRLMQADRGSPKVFKQTKEGENKDYSCMIVCDRSGSMSSRMEDVELAAGAVAYGLEEVGVDTSILDTYNSKTSLAKPFGSSVEDFEKKLFAGRIGGGTPLQHTVSFARQRMERGEGQYPFMIVITDGGVSSRGLDKFKEEIRDANFPVMGLYLTNHKQEEQLELYDRAKTVSSDGDVASKLINLIQTIIF